MEEIKNSPLLDFIIERAMHANGQALRLSASRFLYISLKLVAGQTDYKLSKEEWGRLENLLNQYLPAFDPDYIDVRGHLSGKIARGDGESPLDEIFMQKKLKAAREAALQRGEKEVSAFDVLEFVLRDAENLVRECRSVNFSQVSGGWTEEDDGGPAPDADHAEREKNGPPADRSAELQENRKTVARLIDRVKRMGETLSRTVLGQENAVSVFTEGYYQSEILALTEENRTKPRASFLFAGAPGVGKTFLAEKTAELLGLPYKRFDMSEYSGREAPLEFIGSDKVYKNGRRGSVTGFVLKHPCCVLLFDEIEKAHANIIHLFLQMLDAGRLRDSYEDEEVSFTDAIVIFTTNAGRRLYESADGADFGAVPRKVVLKALLEDLNPETGAPFFPAAIGSRFASGNVVMFNRMSAHVLREIAKRELLTRAASFEEKFGVRVRFEEEVFSALLFAEGGSADARTVKSRAGQFFDAELYELFRLLGAKKAAGSVEAVEEISFTVELPADRREITGLFACEGRPEVLLVASRQTAEACERACEEVDYRLAQSAGEAKRVMRERDPVFALLDMSFQLRREGSYLNIEDMESTARELFWLIRENYGDLPVYLLQTDGLELSPEEDQSFLRLGACGVIRLEAGSGTFAKSIRETVRSLHQQACMTELARTSRLVVFETAQQIFDGGRRAGIKLFDFEMTLAVDAGDDGQILNKASRPDVTFDQVIGAEEAKRELSYFVDYLRDPKKYIGTGVSAPKGVLLYGPPGTGKTMLAKAAAAESGVAFLAAEGNQFLRRFVGEGPQSVHEIFRTARKYAPAILFIDEIDAIALDRSQNETTHSASVLTAFLAEMDGFRSDLAHPVFVLAATNCDASPGSRVLDPALLRRFDRRIFVDVPDRAGRAAYIRRRMAETGALKISEEAMQDIAVRSTGMSLAELASVIELALRSAVRSGASLVTDELFEEAFETFNNGETKKWDSRELERTARHEAGHALLCWRGGETPAYLTIVARGGRGGYMQHDDREGKGLYTKRELLSDLRTALGGRAAEILYYGEEDGLSTGAASDLDKATALATRILCSYGMDSQFGPSTVDPRIQTTTELSSLIWASVNELLREELRNALRILRENRGALDALVERLLAKNHMTGKEIESVLRDSPRSAGNLPASAVTSHQSPVTSHQSPVTRDGKS